MSNEDWALDILAPISHELRRDGEIDWDKAQREIASALTLAHQEGEREARRKLTDEQIAEWGNRNSIWISMEALRLAIEDARSIRALDAGER